MLVSALIRPRSSWPRPARASGTPSTRPGPTGWLICCAPGGWAVNSYLTVPELAYILNNSTSKLLITSRACLQVALEAARDCPGLTSGLIVDGTGDDGIFADFEEATRAFPGTPIADECLGRRCSTPRARPAGPRASCGPWTTSRPVTSSPCSASCPGCGSTGKGSPTCRQPRYITRRRRPRSTWPSDTAEP